MKKKDGLRIVDMCIYVDNNIYNETYDEVKIYEYIKTIVQSLAIKKGYFTNPWEYEPFSTYMATRIFLRLTSKKQFLPAEHPKHLEKVKSVLNLIKKLLYPCKVEYQNSAYNDVIKEVPSGVNNIRETLTEEVIHSQEELTTIEVEVYLRDVRKIVWDIINSTPYSNDKLIKLNLYISVLLTFLRSITMSKKNKLRLSSDYMRANARLYNNTLTEIYKIEQETAPVLWHLEKDFISYVRILYLRVKEQITKDIQELSQLNIPSDDFIEELLMQPVKEKSND